MATANEKLANSLSALKNLQDGGRRVFQSAELSRVHRERLKQAGFVHEIIRGWLMSGSPDTREGDSTLWYASFWEFSARYAASRFGQDWHLSPEQSLLLHAQNTAIPTRVVVYSPNGTGNPANLPFQTSLYELKTSAMPPATDLTTIHDLRVYTTAAALVKLQESFFQRFPIEAQVALSAIGDSSALLAPLLEGGHPYIAGRLAGALRRVGRTAIADDIVVGMKAADFVVRESDPFDAHQRVHDFSAYSPIVARIRALWAAFREPVLALAPATPGLPDDKAAYLKAVDDIYKSDAYHSLAIEGYTVTPELIDRVRSGQWNLKLSEADRKSRDALAARGYWQAFQSVKATVSQILEGEDPGSLIGDATRAWYRDLFQPSLRAGLFPASALAGFRNIPLYLRGSRHVPPRWESIPDAMGTLFDLLAQEPSPFVRGVLGHWMMGYIHPFPDGNGRTARFLMNAMLASGGFSWLVIHVEDRADYLASLDAASVSDDIVPFTRFIAERARTPTQA